MQGKVGMLRVADAIDLASLHSERIQGTHIGCIYIPLRNGIVGSIKVRHSCPHELDDTSLRQRTHSKRDIFPQAATVSHDALRRAQAPKAARSHTKECTRGTSGWAKLASSTLRTSVTTSRNRPAPAGRESQRARGEEGIVKSSRLATDVCPIHPR